MRVLITGAGGQLGKALAQTYSDHDVVALGRDALDVTIERAVNEAIGGYEPDLVLNAAAWTDVDGCERDPDRAHQVNALGAWWVAKACDRFGSTMLHVSTDYVFGARSQDRSLTERDPVAPVNAYGRSKAASEDLVRSSLRRHYIVRTSWLAGSGGSNFVTTMLRVSRERGEVAVVDDQFGSPTFTRDLAWAIRELAGTGRYGTYHRTNTGSCSWFEYAGAVFELAGMDVALRGIPSDELERDAPRPRWAVLSNRHAEASGLTSLPHWRDGLAELLKELDILRGT